MDKKIIRKPAVAGQFYAASPDELTGQIESFVDKKAKKTECLGCMLPHAGYMYSGYVAGQTISHVHIKSKVILLGPNHTGFGKAFSIMAEGAWQTPLGKISIDSDLAEAILKKSPQLADDFLAHEFEHSLEVELPFLQFFKNDFEIVPITMFSDRIDLLRETGKQIAEAIKESGIRDQIMLLASSDMTHYESQAQATRKDHEAIEAILELDENKLMDKVRRLNISMCGYAPVITMISCLKSLEAKSAKLISYQTSGDVTGDTSAVVGYAGIIFY